MERPHEHYRKQNLKKTVNIQSKNVINKGKMVKLYYSNIHCYLNDTNMSWDSTHQINLHMIRLKQKHTIRLTCNENKFTRTKPLMQVPNGTKWF